MERLNKACEFAARVHRNQLRKGSFLPYIVHPMAVALLLAQHGAKEDLIIAAILHDTLEDAGAEFQKRIEQEITDFFCADSLTPSHRFTYELARQVSEIIKHEIRKMFGENVLNLVLACSELDHSLTWKERKKRTLGHLQHATPDVWLLCCADKLHNISSIADDYERYGEAVWDKFSKGKDEQRWYYCSLLEVLEQQKHLNPTLFNELKHTVNKVFK